MLHQSRTVIPPFESGGSIVAGAAKLYRPKERLTVSQWAKEHLAFDEDTAPWQAEVMDALSDPETSEVGLMGPAQQGKSEIGLAWIGWSIEHDPADMIVCQPDKSLMQDFVVRRISPMITNIKVLKAELLEKASADNIFLKQFRGMLLTSVWPVAAQFRARPVPRGWLDDFDQIPADIEGQGSAVGLLDSRAESFEGRDTKFVSSSPADDPDKGDIAAFCESGTDERCMPVCPECGDRFEPDTMRDLRFTEGTLDEAERTAHVICPVNGCVLEPSARRKLIASLSTLPNRGFVVKNPAAGKRRRGFRVDGLLGFKSWTERARQLRDAQLAWETRQDESALRSFVNTKAGQKYRSKLSGEKPVASSDLAARREAGFAIGTVPAGVKVIVIVVDAQANRFECMAFGFGDGLEGWVIDRWAIDVLDDGLTTLAPFREPEHADVLLPLWSKTWPLADGSGQSPPALCVAIDTGGGGFKGDGWTASAKRLWHKATGSIASGGWGIHRSRVTLLKGGNNPRGKLMPPAEFADRKMAGGAKRHSPQLWLPNVHSIKNIIDARLRRTAPGPGYIHLPGADRPGARKREKFDQDRGLEAQYLDEITAEELQKGRWEKIRPRNETWDHLVYAYAAILKPPFAQSRTEMHWVPVPYRVPDQAGPSRADAASNGSISEAPSAPLKPLAAKEPSDGSKPTRRHRVNRKTWAKPAQNWLNRRGR